MTLRQDVPSAADDPTAAAALAEAAQAAGDWASAAGRWKDCLSRFADHQDRCRWLGMRGDALLKLGRLEEARLCFATAAASFPELPVGSAGLARVAQQGRDWTDAIRRWDDCLARFRNRPERRSWLAMRSRALVKTRRYDEARRCFGAMVAEFPDDRHGRESLAWSAERQWRWREAIADWERCRAAANGPDVILPTARKAYCLIEMGEIRLAHELFAGLAGESQSRQPGLEGLAKIATLQDLPEAAIGRWGDCIARFPDAVGGHLGKAELLLDREDYAQADALLAQAVLRWPGSSRAALLWARCATAERRAEAGDRWRRVLAGHGDDPQVRAGYVVFLALSGQDDAVTAFISSLVGDEIAGAECLLEYHVAREDLGGALDPARHLVELDPENPWRRWRLTEVLIRHGATESLEAALDSLETLLGRCPDSVAVKARLVELCIRLGREQQARDLLRTIPPEDHRIEVEPLRAWDCHAAGDEVSARRLWREILRRRYCAALHAPIGSLTRLQDGARAIRPGEIVLFSVMRNERPRLRWFLDHYRRLGVDRFVIVDNDSSDGSAEFLAGRPDVIVYRTTDSFRRSGFGMRWVNELVERHGRNGWCLYVDADEALIFPECERIGLRGLVDYLSAQGYEVVLAPMLDMYPASPPGAGAGLAAHLWFDNALIAQGHPACPYRLVLGGIRRRLLAGYTLMQKTPLIRGDRGIKFLLSSHHVTPARVADVTAALLHYHLLYYLADEFRHLAREAVERGEHASGAVERRRALNSSSLRGPASLLSPASLPYESSRQLVEIGVLRASPAFRWWCRNLSGGDSAGPGRR